MHIDTGSLKFTLKYQVTFGWCGRVRGAGGAGYGEQDANKVGGIWKLNHADIIVKLLRSAKLVFSLITERSQLLINSEFISIFWGYAH
jgi:hypothetical protein